MALKNALYPHLLPDDIALWEDFLTQHSAQFTQFEYDVRVGEGRQAADYYPDQIRKMALDLSMRRIDAIGYTEAETFLIEITVSAGLKAIGQIITYPLLYKQTFPTATNLHPLLVARQLEPDIRPALIEHQIDYILIPA